MFIGILTLLTALSISAVAIYYSVAGLAAIFAAAVLPIVVMGVSLELGKLVTALWLHQNWHRTTWWMKSYLAVAVVVLMFITSLGIFGFLSKAHIEQTTTAGDNSLQIELLETQIQREQARIDNAQLAVDQLDSAVNTLIEFDRIRGNDGAIAVRENQRSERDSLNAIIDNAQTKIVSLEKEKIELSREQVILEAEVGPLKYIAEFVYGNEADQNILEEAVRWVIVTIIFVFDPLAILLLIASQLSFANALAQRREQKQQQALDELVQHGEEHGLYETTAGANPLVKEDKKTTSDTETVADYTDEEWEQAVAEDLEFEAQQRELARAQKISENVPPVIPTVTASQTDYTSTVLPQNYGVSYTLDIPQSLVKQPDQLVPDHEPETDKESVDPAIEQWNNMIQRANEEMEKERNARQLQQEKIETTFDSINKKLDLVNQRIDTASKESSSESDADPEESDRQLVPDVPEIDTAAEQEYFAEQENLEKTFVDPGPEFEEWEQPKDPSKDTPNNEEQVPESTAQRNEIVEETAEDDSENASTVSNNSVEKEVNTQPETSPAQAQHPVIEEPTEPTEEELKMERDNHNKMMFLQEVPVTEEDAREHPPITKSRKAFFDDYIDDVLRGTVTADMLPPDVAKTVALFLSDYEGPAIVEPVSRPAPSIKTVSREQFVEENQPEIKTEDRDMTDSELDDLISAFEQDNDLKEGEYDVVIKGGVKQKVPKKGYVQNEEQTNQTLFGKILDIKEPEKNEILLPELKNTNEEDIPVATETAQDLSPTAIVSPEKIKRHKAKMLSNVEYQQRVENRINTLIKDIEEGKLKLDELSLQDREIVLNLLNTEE